MFDGIGIKHIEFLDKKKFDNQFELLQVVNTATGEVNGNKFAKCNGLHFTKTAGNIYKMNGSLHKYKNNGLHNRDNFKFKDVCKVIDEFKNTYGIDTDTTKINTFEFGLNIAPDFNPNTFLKRLLTHKNIRFNRDRNRDGEKFCIAKHEDYYVKIYSKSEGILRFEIKTKRSKYFKEVRTLSDLKKKEVWQLAHQKLIKEFENVIYWEELKEHTPAKVSQYITEKQNLKYLETPKRNKYKELNKYQEYLQKYGKNNYHTIKDLLNEKYNKLTNNKISVKNGCKLPNFSPIEKIEKVQITILDKLIKCTSSKCKVTGLDISMQKKGSKFLSISGIEFYQDNNPIIYMNLEKRLSKKWDKSNLKTRNTEIAHSIRNEYFNKINNTKRGIKKILQYPSLFNENYIDRDKLNIAGITEKTLLEYAHLK